MKQHAAPYLLTLLLLLPGGASAAGTAAGTVIRNQASATYTDPGGDTQTVISDEIITTVRAVYSFVITPDGTPSAPGQNETLAAGATSQFFYTVVNQGNIADTIKLSVAQSGTDSFDLQNLRIYLDEDRDGLLDPGEPFVTSVDLDADEAVQLIVVGTVPSGVGAETSANLNLEGTSEGAPGDTDVDNWARATVSGDGGPASGVVIGNSDGDPDTAPSGTGITVSAAAGTPVSYPLELTNTGSAPDTFGVTVSNLPVGWTAETFADADCDGEADRTTPLGTVGPVEPGENVCVVVTVTPAAGTQPGSTSVTVTATSRNDPTVNDSITNTLVIEEEGGGGEDAAGVNIGNGDENAATGPSDDSVSVTTMPGTPVDFPLELANTGDAADTFNLTILGLPSGWTALIFADDDCNGAADNNASVSSVGPLIPGENACVVVTVVPAPGAFPGNTSVTVVATSQNDADVSDRITNTVVIEDEGGGEGEDSVGADIGNSDGDPDTTPSGTNISVTARPGTPTSYPLELTNLGEAEDSFDLAISTLPSGWAAEVFADTNCDGVADDDTPTGSVGPLAPGENICLVVIVTPAADAVPGRTRVTVMATSRNDPSVADSITNTVVLEDEGGGGNEDAAGVNIGNGDENAATNPGDAGVSVTVTPGTPASYPLELTNTGDGADTFDLGFPNVPAGWTVEIYADADCDAVRDGVVPLGSVGPLDPGENVCLVVTVTPPADARSGSTPITVTATSRTDPGVSDSITNTVVISGGGGGGDEAAGVDLGSGDKDPETGPGNVGISVTATPGTPASYPLEVRNTGDTSDTFDLTVAQLPSGWTAEVFTDGDCDGVADSGSPVTSVGPLAPNENVCLVVVVIPAADAAPGNTNVTVTATSQNDPAVSDSFTVVIAVEGDGGDGGEEGAAGVDIGNGDGNPATPPGNAGITVTATPGSPANYPLEVTNSGESVDSFGLAVPSVPTGWTVQFFADADCDGVADDSTPISSVGPLDPDETACVVLAVTPPADAEDGSTAITVTATSRNEPAVVDSITNTVVVRSGTGEGSGDAGVDIGNGDGDASTDPSNAGITVTAAPGTPVSYPIELTNTGEAIDTFNLTIPNLPPGWTAQIFADANCDAAPDSDTPIGSVGPLEPSETVCLVVTVTPAAGTEPGSTPVTVTATSQDDASVSDSITNTIVVEGGGERTAGVDVGNGDGDLDSGPSDAARTIPATAGTPVTFPVELTNTGESPDIFELTIPNLPTGWTAEIFLDASCDGDPDDGTPITSVGPVAPGENVCLVVTVTPAEDAQAGSTAVTVAATSRNDSGVSDSITNTVVIEDENGGGGSDGDGRIILSKSVSPGAPVAVGETLTYTVAASNTGDGPVTDLRVYDPLPENSAFVSAVASTTVDGEVLYSTNGSSWSPSPPSTLGDGSGVHVGVDTNGDAAVSATDTFGAGGVLSLTFVVEVTGGPSVRNQASAAYDDQTVSSETVSSDVDANAPTPPTTPGHCAVSVTPDGTVVAPGQLVQASPGATVYLPYTLQSLSDDAVDVMLGATTLEESTAAATGLRVIADENANGALDAGEAPVDTPTDIPEGGSVSLLLEVTLATGAGSLYVNLAAECAGDASGEDGEDLTNVSQIAVLQEGVSSLTKLADPEAGTPLYAGADVSYIISFTAAAMLSDVVVTDVIDEDLVLPASYTTGTLTDPRTGLTADVTAVLTDRTLTWTFAAIPAGMNVTLTMGTSVSDDAATQATVDNTACLSAPGLVEICSDPVRHPLPPVEIELTKTALDTSGRVGESVSFELVATNPSATVPIQDSVLVDTLPEGLESVPSSAVSLNGMGAEVAFEPTRQGNVLTWALPDIAPGEAFTLRFDARVTAEALGQEELVNDARIDVMGERGAVASDEDQAVIAVESEIFGTRSVLTGHLYEDTDGSGNFTDGDRPVSAARLYLSNGVSVVTDAFGRYTASDLPSGVLALRLDETTTTGLKLSENATPTEAYPGLWRVRLHPGLITRQDIPFTARPRAAEPSEADTQPAIATAGQDDLPKSPVETLAGVHILAPAPGEVVRGRTSVPIIVETPLNDEVVVSVNGQTLPLAVLGTRVFDEARGRQRFEYIGVRFHEGPNEIVLSSTPRGGVVTRVATTVALAGPTERIVITPVSELTADSAAPLVFALRLEDAFGNAPADTFVTIEAAGANLATEDANPRSAGLQVRTSGGEAQFALAQLPVPAPVELRAEVQGVQVERDFAVRSAVRPWVGAASGSLGASYTPGEPLEFGVSGSLFARGTLAGQLVTLGVRYPQGVLGAPSDPVGVLPTEEVIDPEIVSGSSGTQSSEARSQDGFYLRVENDLSFVQYGDFATDLVGPLLGGGRELTGLSGRYAGFSGGFEARGYASYQAQGEAVENRDLSSNGTSLYRLPAGLEALEVSVVTKDDFGSVVSETDLVRTLDYRYTPATGELLLSEPLPLQNALGNRYFLRLSYRFPADVGAPRVLEAGAQVAYDAGAVTPRVGVVQAQNGAAMVRTFSAGVGVEHGSLTAQADLAYGGDESSDGLAAEAQAQFDGERFDASATYRYTAPGYRAPALGSGGRSGQEARFGVSYDASEALKLSANAQAAQTLSATGDDWRVRADLLGSYRLSGEAALGSLVLASSPELQLGAEYDDGTPRALAGVRLRTPLGFENADFSVLHRQALSPALTSETDLEFRYRILGDVALTVTERLEWGVQSNLLVGLESGIDNAELFGTGGYAGRTTLSTHYEIPGGLNAQEGRARFGLTTLYPITDAWSIDASLEQTLDFSGPTGDRTVATFGTAYDSDDVDAQAGYQLSFGDGDFNQLASAGGNFRVSDNLFGGVSALYSVDSTSDTPHGFSFNVAGAYRSVPVDVLTSHTLLLGSLSPEGSSQLIGEVRAAAPFSVRLELSAAYLYRGEAELGLQDMSALGASLYPWQGGSVSAYGQLFHLWQSSEFIPGASLEVSQNVACGLYGVLGYNLGGIEDPLGPGYGGSGVFIRLDLIADEQLLCGGVDQ